MRNVSKHTLMNIPETGELVSESSARRRINLGRFRCTSSPQHRDAVRFLSRDGTTEDSLTDASSGDDSCFCMIY